jgi:hypothetical protein
MFEDFPYIDFDDFNSLGIDVVLEDGTYNVQLVFLNVLENKDPREGMVFRTPFFCKSLEEVGAKIKQLHDVGIFYHLNIFAAGNIISITEDDEEEVLEIVDWNQYCDFSKITAFIPKYQQSHTIH